MKPAFPFALSDFTKMTRFLGTPKNGKWICFFLFCAISWTMLSVNTGSCMGNNNKKTETAFFGAGCFWGVEAAYRQKKGVHSTSVGYMGGTLENPSYKDVCTGNTGHAEVVEVIFDPSQISYEDILDVFWEIHDPTTLNRQGPDVGTQYRSVIFYMNEEQYRRALRSKEKIEKSGTYQNKIVTEIAPVSVFYRGEDYHQQYLEKRGLPACRIE